MREVVPHKFAFVKAVTLRSMRTGINIVGMVSHYISSVAETLDSRNVASTELLSKISAKFYRIPGLSGLPSE